MVPWVDRPTPRRLAPSVPKWHGLLEIPGLVRGPQRGTRARRLRWLLSAAGARRPRPGAEPCISNVIEQIEYVSGEANTEWGAERINGHCAPFPLHYVKVVKEDWSEKSGSYDDRSARYYKAFNQRYPALQLVATAPLKSIKPGVLDHHYYMFAESRF